MSADPACWQCGHGLDEARVFRAEYLPKQLLDLGLSPKFVEFVFLDPKPEAFRYRCEARDGGWASYVPEDVSAVYPVWTCNGDVTAVWIRAGRQEFLELYHDDPEFRLLGPTEQNVLLELFLSLYEADDWLDSAQSLGRLQQLADVAGFRYLRELHEWHSSTGSAPDFEERWDRFVASLIKR
jgi:hypothetical protein